MLAYVKKIIQQSGQLIINGDINQNISRAELNNFQRRCEVLLSSGSICYPSTECCTNQDSGLYNIKNYGS